MAKIENTNEGRVNATATINWKGKYLLFNITATETLETFLVKLQNSIRDLGDDYLSKEGFYMFTLGTPSLTEANKHTRKELSYIGKASGQTLRERIPQVNGHEGAFNCIINNGKGYTLFLGLGVITETSLEVETEKLIEDIECCMIFTNQPTCNDTCKDGYNSELRRTITIHHTGAFIPLRQDTTCR